MNCANLSNEELVQLWYANRNGMLAVMAANEVMNRVEQGLYVLVDADEHSNCMERIKELENETD